ncbi:MAG: hypothetical protein Q4A49_01850 [Neisseria sp.]|nr:hypothetical protein [Neisseria sp.]
MLETKNRRIAAAARGSNVFGILVSEMALGRGDVRGALHAYIVLFERTKSPEIAGRALEIAVALRDRAAAERIYQSWLAEDEEKTHPGWQRADWLRALADKDYHRLAATFAGVLSQASERERGRMFLQTAQIAADHAAAVPVLLDTVVAQAEQYADMPEAAAALTAFAVSNGKDDAVAAGLARLVRTDGHFSPFSLATLRLLEKRRPELLVRFWQQLQAEELPASWQKQRIVYLLDKKRTGEAFAALDKLSSEYADSELYFSAAQAAEESGAGEALVQRYLDKAFHAAEPEMQSRIALLAAARLFEQGRFDASEQWINRADASPSLKADRMIARLMLAVRQERWSDAERSVRKLYALKNARHSIELFTWNNVYEAELALVVRKHNSAEALKNLNRLYRAVAADGNSSLLDDILMERGILYADKIGNAAKAVADFRELLKRNPDNPLLKNSLGYTMLYLSDADTDAALKLILEAYRELPLSAEVNDSLGWAYFKKGEREKALHYLTFAFQNAEEAEIAAHLGEVLWSLGRKDEARAVFRRGESFSGGQKILRDTLRRLGLSKPTAPAAKPKQRKP